MKRRTTLLLLMLDLALAIVSAIVLLQFDDARSNAQRDQADADVVLQDLNDIAAVRRPIQGGEPSQQITAGLQAAANTAGITQQLQSVEAGPARSGDEQPTLSIRLGAVTLEQLCQFLIKLEHSAQPLVSSNIHLSIPQGPDAITNSNGEAWTTEIALQAAINDTPR